MNMEKVYLAAYQIVMGEEVTVELSGSEHAEAVRIAKSLGCDSCGG